MGLKIMHTCIVIFNKFYNNNISVFFSTNCQPYYNFTLDNVRIRPINFKIKEFKKKKKTISSVKSKHKQELRLKNNSDSNKF